MIESPNYKIYVLLNKRNGKRYVGITSRNVHTRLKEHNSGMHRFTKGNIPYSLIYFETGYCKSCARNRELFLKSGQGRKVLDIWCKIS